MTIRNTSYLLIILGLIGYSVPWIIAPMGAPLTLNAYDLAEWTSLHPSQLLTTPILVVPLFIRLQLLIISLFIGLFTRVNKLVVFGFIGIILLSLAQLPPLEFLTIATDNPNYIQQFMFALFSLIFGNLLIVLGNQKAISIITILLSIIGIFSSIVGLQQAQQMYTLSLQEYSTGIGIAILLVSYSGIALLQILNLLVHTRANSEFPVYREIKQGS